jgi:hypothetical protein
MHPATKRTAAAAMLAGLVLAGGQAVATAQTPDPSNRMDLGEFYATAVGDYQAGVEAECGCTGTVLDRSAVGGVHHKTVEYADTADHQFRVTYFRSRGVWTVEHKDVVADGQVFPFRSDRS